MKERKNEEEINDIFTRGVGEFIDPEGIFRKKLENNPEKIVIKFGVDPTRPDIHLGHAVVLRKLRQLQDLGCKVVFLVGDYTAQIGDPTGKSKIRPEIDQQEVEKNMKTYLEQIGKILNLQKEVFSWIRNSDWFTAITDITSPPGKIVDGYDANSFMGKTLIFQQTRMQIKELGMKEQISVITLRSFLWMLKHITHSQIIERDLFRDRINNKEELYLHEMMYPILQGIDSLVLLQIYKACDLEVGGTDQHFNMLMGRTVMKAHNKPEQSILSFKLLEGTDGKEKMSKSLDNYIGITDEPNDMYGKVMSIPDSSIENYFELCTPTPIDEVEKIRQGVLNGSIHPKEIKMKLAYEIVKIYHGEKKAKEAEENFIKTFQKKEIPNEMEKINSEIGERLADVLVKNHVLSSKGEWRRLVEGNAVHNLLENKNITESNIKITENLTLKIGKKKFVKILVK